MTDPRIQARRVDVARLLGRSRRRRIVVVAVMVAIAGGVFGLLHSPVLGARHVTVKGAPVLARAEVIAVAGLKDSPPLIDLDAAVIAARVERLPWVAKAAVRISWPSSVSIRLTERTPVADVKDGSRYAVCDPTGRVIETLGWRTHTLPLVTISGRPGPAGSMLPVQDRQLALVAATMPEALVRKTLEVALSPTAGIVVVLRDGITVDLGDAGSLIQKFVSLETVLARVPYSGPVEIDLRVAASPLLIRNPTGPMVPGNAGG
jgi:cell division protein FtsQ